jgi:hypothetical protein
MDTRIDIDDPDGDIYTRRGRVSQINPAPVQGWSSGGLVETSPPGAPFESAKQLGLQVSFQEADIYTVQFSRSVAPNGGGLYRARARITWSVQGNSTTRILDVVDGASISGTCRSLNVDVYDFFSNPNPGDTEEYFVSILATPGTRPTSGAPPLLNLAEGANFEAAAGTVFDVPVPLEAGGNSFFLSIVPQTGTIITPNSDDIIIVQRSAPAAGIIALGNYESFANQWVPLYPGCGSIQLQNNTAGNMEFSVVLGIQG